MQMMEVAPSHSQKKKKKNAMMKTSKPCTIFKNKNVQMMEPNIQKRN